MPSHPTNPDVAVTEGRFWAEDPHPTLAWMRANAPVYWDEAGEVWAISRYDDVKAVSKDPATFSNAGGIRPQLGPIPMMIDMDDPEHSARRKLVNKGFTPKRVRAQEAKIRRVCQEIIDGVAERGGCDLVHEVAAQLPMIMIGDMLGVAPEDRADLLRWSDDMMKSQSGSATEEALLTAHQAFEAYQAYALQVIADRRAAGPTESDELMSILVHAEVDGDRLDDEELVWQSLLILVGGDETTRHVISEGMWTLTRHPDQYAALREDRSLLPGAVEEMLRWVSPLKNMARTATRDVEVGGQQVAAGQKLLLLYPSANRDEAVFDDPQTFDIRRSPNDHVAFGFGTHFCLGASLARLELREMVDALLDRLPDLEVAVPPEEVRIRPANFVTGPSELPVRYTPVPVGG